MGRYPSTTAHAFDILRPVVAHYGESDAPTRLFTSDFLHRCRYTAVARIWTCGGGKAWHPAATALELANTALCARYAMDMDVLISRIGMQDSALHEY